MLEFFRKNLFINSLLLLPFCLLIRIKGVIKPIPYNFVSERESSIFNNLMELVSSNWVQGLLASLIVYMQALIINRLCIKHRVAKEMTLIPGLVYITISAVIPDLLSLSPMLIGSTFIIIAVHLLFNTYNSVAAASDIFSAGFLIGLAGVFYFPYYYFFIVSFIALIILKSFTFKERIQHSVAWVIPTLLLWVWEFFNNEPLRVIPDFFWENFGVNQVLFIQDIKSLIISVLIGILVLIFLVNFSNYTKQKVTSTQKKISILYWVMAYSGLVLLMIEHLQYSHIFSFLFPAAIFTTLSLLNFKNKIVAEIIFLVLLIVVVIVQFDLIQL